MISGTSPDRLLEHPKSRGNSIKEIEECTPDSGLTPPEILSAEGNGDSRGGMAREKCTVKVYRLKNRGGKGYSSRKSVSAASWGIPGRNIPFLQKHPGEQKKKVFHRDFLT